MIAMTTSNSISVKPRVPLAGRARSDTTAIPRDRFPQIAQISSIAAVLARVLRRKY
jgi:hypothetical protein